MLTNFEQTWKLHFRLCGIVDVCTYCSDIVFQKKYSLRVTCLWDRRREHLVQR